METAIGLGKKGGNLSKVIARKYSELVSFLIPKGEGAAMLRSKKVLISTLRKAKIGVDVLAKALHEMGWTIYSSGGTATFLEKASIPVIRVDEVTEFPECLSGRVKTIHPKIAGGFLALDKPEHDADREKLGIPWFDMVVIDLYALEQTTLGPGATAEVVAENLDIGGDLLLRVSAKGFRITLFDPADFGTVIHYLKDDGDVPMKFRRWLSAKAFAACAQCDLVAARFLSGGVFDGVIGQLDSSLKYGEAGYLKAAFFRNLQLARHPLSFSNGVIVSELDPENLAKGRPGYVGVADLTKVSCAMACFVDACRNFGWGVPFIAFIAKHGNPCGAGFSFSGPAEAIARALIGDEAAGMGGEMITNFEITSDLAELIFESDAMGMRLGGQGVIKWTMDALMAPSFSQGAIELLGKREKRVLITLEALKNPTLVDLPPFMRMLPGNDFLRQDPPTYSVKPEDLTWVSGKMELEQIQAMVFADCLARWSSSNTIVICSRGMLVGMGCGQQARHTCCKVAALRMKDAGHEGQYPWFVFASDAFFPFDDGPQILKDMGCVGGIVPIGGKRNDAINVFFRENDMRVARIPGQYRGFAWH